jgi:hypothetical protein
MITTPIMQSLALLPSCHTTINGQLAIGRPAIRIADFVSRFADNGLFSSVCKDDYSPTFDAIGQKLKEKVTPCIEGHLDTTDRDPANPGAQIDCSVIAIESPDAPDPIEHVMPTCTMTGPETPAPDQPPCWWIQSNPAACTTPTGLELHFQPDPPPKGSTFRVRCATN